MKEGKTGRDGKERGAGLGAGGLGHPPPCWGQSRDTHQRHPGSAFGEGAAPLLGAGLVSVPSSGLGRVGDTALPTGAFGGVSS